MGLPLKYVHWRKWTKIFLLDFNITFTRNDRPIRGVIGAKLTKLCLDNYLTEWKTNHCCKTESDFTKLLQL